MEITIREMVTTVHGMLFGGFFLMGIFGLLVDSAGHPSLLKNPDLHRAGVRWNGAI